MSSMMSEMKQWTSPDIVKALGMLVGIVATFYFSVLKTFNRDGIRWRRALKGNHKIKPLLSDFVLQEHPSCIVALKFLENSGGTPRPGALLFSSTFAEVNDIGAEDQTGNWQRVRIGETYNETLMKALLEGEITTKLDDLRDSEIKFHYLARGAIGLDVISIKTTKAKWWYLEVAHCKEPADTPEHRERLRVLIQTLENLLK